MPFFFVIAPEGVEPSIPRWERDVLTTWPWGHGQQYLNSLLDYWLLVN